MISPKLVLQCSAVSLVTAAVMTVPVWMPTGGVQSESRMMSAVEARVEREKRWNETPSLRKTALPPVAPQTPIVRDDRSIEQRNQSANAFMVELNEKPLMVWEGRRRSPVREFRPCSRIAERENH